MIHPDLEERLHQVEAALLAFGAPIRRTQTERTTEQQQALYAQGRTAPGNIVTNADGVIHKSNHQVQEDGYGYAVDCCFVGPDPYLEHVRGGPALWRAYGALAKAAGLKWGGDFTTIKDMPHVELPGQPPSKGPKPPTVPPVGPPVVDVQGHSIEGP